MGYRFSLEKNLDRLPLALAMAGAYLNHAAIGFSDNLRLYEGSWLKLQKTSAELNSYEDGMLYSSWQVSLTTSNNRTCFQLSFSAFGHTL